MSYVEVSTPEVRSSQEVTLFQYSEHGLLNLTKSFYYFSPLSNKQNSITPNTSLRKKTLSSFFVFLAYPHLQRSAIIRRTSWDWLWRRGILSLIVVGWCGVCVVSHFGGSWFGLCVCVDLCGCCELVRRRIQRGEGG
jgi:hypothetical protein